MRWPRPFPVLPAMLLSLAFAAPAGAVCIVDPTQTAPFGSTFASIAVALTDPLCNAPGSVIDIWCPAAGCSETKVEILGLSGITIRSMETTIGAGPVTFTGTGPDLALRVEGSAGIVISGISVYSATGTAIRISDSGVRIAGPGALATPRYGQVQGPVTGMEVAGASDVVLRGIGFTGSSTGLRITSPGSVPPSVTASGVAFQDNLLAVEIAGPALPCPAPGTVANPALLQIRGDFATAWTNYVMHNLEGFRLTGRAELRLDHTVLSGNLYQLAAGGTNPVLFSLDDSSRLAARNILAYDNDMTPGLTGPFAGVAGTAGYLFYHRTCDQTSLQASTIVNNAADNIFEVRGSGLVTLDHTLISGSWGKVLSESIYYTSHGNTCPRVTAIASNFYNNRISTDPPACQPPAPALGTAWNPMVMVPAMPPPSFLSGYPDIPAERTDLYLIRRRQPINYAIPPNLYLGRPWGVDGMNPDTNKLDVGYHNPM